MIKHNSLNVRLCNPQFNILKSGTKNGTEVTLNLSSNVIDDSNDKTNFPHKLLSTDKQASKIRQVFANNSTAVVKLSKTQLSNTSQLGGFLPSF